MTVEPAFVGGTGTVTGSKYLLKADAAPVPVDRSLFKGSRRCVGEEGKG